MRFAHTNLIARNWEALARFYEEVFACEPVPPARDLGGDWLARGTGIPGARLAGIHLRVPGHGPAGPTLEIFSYDPPLEADEPAPDRPGWGHVAFEVGDVAEVLAKVVAAGGCRLGEVVTREVADVGTLTFTYARDPEGNVVELQRWERGGATRPVGAAGVGVVDAYEAWAESYDTDANTTRDADAAVLRALLPDLAGRDVLEVGCGTGKNTAALTGARSVLAIDLSPAMLTRARARVDAPSVRFARADLRDGFPAGDASVDLVTFDLVLEHVEDLGPVLAEVARVLRPGGRALVIEYHPMRQLRGRGARFGAGEEIAEVEAYLHLARDFVEAARAAGLRVDALGEWGDAGERYDPARGALPRLLSLELTRV